MKGLKALLKSSNTPKQNCEILRDQIRARLAVYHLKARDLPRIGSGESIDEKQRLEAEVAVLVEQKLPRRKCCPLPLTLREAHDSPTEEALKQDREHVQNIVAATQEFLLLVSNGVMKMRRPSSKQRKKKEADIGSTRKCRVSVKRKRKEPNASEMALVGEEFEEEGIEWCVLVVRFDEELDDLVVYYYDMASGLSREELMCDLEHDDVERSSVKEVVQWIKDSSK